MVLERSRRFICILPVGYGSNPEIPLERQPINNNTSQALSLNNLILTFSLDLIARTSGVVSYSLSICVLPGTMHSQTYLGPLSLFAAMSQLSLVSNSYLDDLSNKTRSKPVPWEVRPGHWNQPKLSNPSLTSIDRATNEPN